MYADDIKIRLLNWLLPRLSPDDLLGSEVRIMDSNVVADFVLSTQTSLLGFEIKSKRDSLRRLTRQLPAYLQMFHETYLVVDATEPRLRNIRRLSERAGIIAVGEGEVFVLKAAKGRKLLTKEAASNWLRRKEVPMPYRNLDITAARGAIRKAISQVELNEVAVRAARERLKLPHGVLIAEVGLSANQDDLQNLHNRQFKIQVD